MADKKISQLPAATTPLTGTEVLPIVQSGTTDKVSVANLTAGRAISATELTLTTGNLVIGTSGKGIDFSAAKSASSTGNLLSYYEVGTWTVTRNGFTEVPGAGSITSTGTYTRIGRVVVATARIVCSGGATIAATGGAVSYLSGLPFAVSTQASGTWCNTSTENSFGGCMAISTNIDLITGWTAAANNGYSFSVTYIV